MVRYAHVLVTFPKIWEDFVEVKWERELLDGTGLKRFHLVATSDDYSVERLFDVKESRYRLVGLKPGSTVKVAIRAQLEGDEWGNWCTSSATLHASVDVSVGMVGPDFIHGNFAWGAQTESSDTHNWMQAVGFHLRVRQKEHVLSTSLCDQELKANQREFAVRGLESDGVFNVQVRAVSQYGDIGKWSEVTRFLTLGNVEVSIVEVGEDYAVAWWGRQGEDVGSLPPSLGSRTSIEQFALRLELAPSQRQLLSNPNAQPCIVTEEVFTGVVSSKKLQGLLSGRIYIIWSRQLNIQGDWSPWGFTKFRTMCSTSMVTVQSVSDSFLLFSWEQDKGEPIQEGVDVIADAAIVNWQVRCINMESNEESCVILPENEASTRIINLPHSTEFSLAVRSKNTYGKWGPWAEPTYVSTLSPLQVHVDAVGEGWLKLNWSRKDKRHYDDSVVRYHVQVSAANTTFRLSKYFPADAVEHRFEDLSPSTEYRVSVQACIGDRWQAWSEAIPVKTAGPAEVHLVRRGEDFIQIRWTSEFYELNGIDTLDQRYQLKILRLSDEENLLKKTDPAVLQEFSNVSGYRVTKLKPSSRVSIQVRAYNAPQAKWGSWCVPRTLSTLPSVISFTMVGETCFEVAWQRKPRTVSAVDDQVPVSDDPLAPAEAVMYILRINELSSDGTSSPLEKYHFTDEDKPFFIVEGLEPSHRYSAQLCTADGQQTWSPWSAPALVTMMPPLKITVLELGEDYCTMKWSREAGCDGNVEHDALDTKYRIAATALTLDSNNGAVAGAQLKYHVDGDTEFTLRHLHPDTSYRLSISAYPNKTNVWGVWSEAVYIRSNASIEVELDAVGEDYAHVSWRRTPPSADLAKLHPCCEIIHLGSAAHLNPTAVELKRIQDTSMEAVIRNNLKPYPLHVADASITQFNVKAFSVEYADDAAETKRTLEYESFLPFESTTLRIPHLRPNSHYEVLACSCNPRGEWGVLSAALALRTTMPTEIAVREITHSHISVRWGRGVVSENQTTGAAAPTEIASACDSKREVADLVEKYLLKVVGPDDDYCKEITIPGDTMAYDIHCLSINCCYSISVKALTEGQWGHWSNPIFVAIRAIRVRLVETSQDWLKLSWHNKAIPDGRPREQFITLIGNARATTKTLPSGSDTEYVFTELSPLTVYSVHLLCVEQVPSYVKKGGWVGRGEDGDVSSLPEAGRPTDTGITIALPLTAADYSSFYTDSCSFSTLANIALEVSNVGENFVTVLWSREVHAHAAEVQREKDADYEVFCCALDGSPPFEFKKKVRGTETTLTGLPYNSLFELRVRKVSLLTSAYSRAVTVQTLDKVRVHLGPPGVSSDELETQIGVGEDFLLLNWVRGAGKPASHTSFVVRCEVVDGEGALLQDAEETPTRETNTKLTDLKPDTRYRVSVRSIIDDEGIARHGEWSDGITLCTLSPMHVRVVGVTEETAEVRWLRKGEIHGETPSIHTISSYHLKIHSIPKNDSEEVVVLDERQLLETHPEFVSRSIRLTGLKPNHSYTTIVRASTENSWGAWSTGITFTTLPLMGLNVNLVGEECIFISWARQLNAKRRSTREVETADAVELAEVATCELSVSTVGKDRVHFSRRLPASPSHYRLEDLTPNMQYSFSLRPCYTSGEYGIWCDEIYCCTLAPITVEVSRIGETFVHVQWSRAPQQRIAARLREQHSQQQRDFETQQRKLQDEIEALRVGIDDGGAFETQFLSNQGGGGGGGGQPALTPVASNNKLEQMLCMQQQQQQKQQHLAKLQDLQLLELERVTRYPDGEDTRYEVVIMGSGANDDSADEDRDKSKPFSFRRRINCSEGKEGESRTCKMDGLQPHACYTVRARAMYGNGYNVAQLASPDASVDTRSILPTAEERERERQEAADQLLWGAWSANAELCTLKQISLRVRGIGSTHCVVDWDTGYATGDAATAISQYQLMVAERDKKKGKPCQDIIVGNSHTLTWTVVGLQVNTQYTITVRVCYDDDRWGLWSNAIAFLTLPALSARVTDVAETGVSVLVWREVQKVNDPALLVWRQKQSELQLSINNIPSPSTFKLDLDTSTLLSLDDLALDSLYQVKSREIDANAEWREWQQVVEFETLSAAPSKPTLDERRGNVITLSWNQRQNRETVNYLYRVEMAYTNGAKGKTASSVGNSAFQPVGFLRQDSLRLELTEPVHRCLFRVKVCKEHQRLEGAVSEEDAEDGYLWSQYSPVAHFLAPSVPQPPTSLKIVNLRDTCAVVKWRKPDNFRSHANLVYKVYLSSGYQDRPACLGTTTKCAFRMDDLMPNTHYRVGCTAESSMGVSQNNHVLHFSTRVLSGQGPLHGPCENPTSSTLPPRNGLRLPLSQDPNRLGVGLGSTCPSPSAMSGMQSGAASLAGSPAGSRVPRSATKAAYSPASSTYPPADRGGAGAAAQRHPRFLPPMQSPQSAF